MNQQIVVTEEPGDGYRYVAVIIPWTAGGCGVLGHVDDGYLVVCGLNGRAHLIQRDGYLSPAYVEEKFKLAPPRAAVFARMVAKAIGRTA